VPLPAWPVVLRALREARGSTQEGWGARLGYSDKTVRRWERGETAPDAAAEAALLELLRAEGLLRSYTAGPLRGLTLTEVALRQLLAEARSGKRTPARPAPLHLVRAALPAPTAGSLPVSLTRLIGRKQELGDLVQRVVTTRLLTLTGPGGSGKTRLAIAVAQGLLSNFPDGVAFVDLSPVTDPAFVPSTIAQVLGLQDVEGVPLAESLAAYARPRRLLLLLDNFEQVMAAAGVVVQLLSVASGLHVLVTSREPLHLPGEQEYPLAPLPLPDVKGATSTAALAQNAAVTLFVERARAVKPNFVLSEGNVADVAAICTRLDGLPLALELAAACSKLLSPRQLLARLEQRLPILSGGARGFPTRQQTLRDTIQWSYDLLSAAEQQLFRNLAGFPGGCTVAGAEALYVEGAVDAVQARHAPALQTAARTVIDGLSSLVDKSLLRVQDGPDGAPRFSMLATVQEYALEQLELRGEAQVVRAAIARAMLTFAEAQCPCFTGPQRQEALASVDVEAENVRAALAWAVETGEPELGLRLAGALEHWFRMRALREGVAWVERLLALPGAAAARRARGWALCTAGDCSHLLSEWDAALARFREALELLDPEEDRRQRAIATRGLAYAAAVGGDVELAGPIARDAVAMARELGEDWLIAYALLPLGLSKNAGAEFGRAYFEEALQYARDAGEPWLLINTLAPLEVIYLGLGDIAAADRVAGEAEAVRKSSGLPLDLPLNAALIGLLRLQLGDRDGARTYICMGLFWSRDAGNPAGISINLVLAAMIALDAGRQRDAGLLHSAALATAAGHASAERLIANPLTVNLTRGLDGLRAALGDEAYAAAWAEGRALGVDAAVALAEGLARGE
jgi:predicted ATPase/transcriptional regulator with XRE-family HTH domain